MGKICAFLGHRDALYYLYQNKHIHNEIILLIENEDVDTFWLGGNGDFDKLANNAVKEVQNKYPHIQRTLVAAYQRQIYPFADEEAAMLKHEALNPLSIQDKKTVPYTLNYDSVIYPEELCQVPKRFAMTYRNRYEVDNADFFICYIKKEYGGAYTAYSLAKRKGKRVINLAESDDVKRSEIEYQKKMEEYKKSLTNI